MPCNYSLYDLYDKSSVTTRLKKLNATELKPLFNQSWQDKIHVSPTMEALALSLNPWAVKGFLMGLELRFHQQLNNMYTYIYI